MVMAWAYQRSVEGVKPDAQVQAAPGSTATSAQPINYFILLIVLLVAGIQVFDRFVSAPDSDQQPVSATNPATASTTPTIVSQLDLGPIQSRMVEEPARLFRGYVDLADDGSLLVFSNYDEGSPQLWIKELSELTPRILFSGNGFRIDAPRISPNKQWVAYGDGGASGLRIRSISGGEARQIGINTNDNQTEWLDLDSLIWIDAGGRLVKYSVSTMESEVISEADHFRYMSGPSAIKGSKQVLFTYREQVGDIPDIAVVDLESDTWRILLSNAYSPKLTASGHLLFMRGSDLWAVSIDRPALQLGATPVPVVQEIENNQHSLIPSATYSVSETGELIYLPGRTLPLEEYRISKRQLTSLDREGNEYPLAVPEGEYLDSAYSADKQRLSVTHYDPDTERPDIWIHDLASPGIMNRITHTGDAVNGIWSQDDNHIIFDRLGMNGLWQVAANGTTEPVQIYPSDYPIFARFLTPDGAIVGERVVEGQDDIYLLDLSRLEGIQQDLLSAEYSERSPSLSPDARWLTYASDETGAWEVYVRPFPNIDANKWRVSVAGGEFPQWSNSGELLHYIDSNRNELVTVDIQTEPEFLIGQRTAVSLRNYTSRNMPPFISAGDEDNVIGLKTPDEVIDEFARLQSPEKKLAVLVSNWFAQLNEVVPRAQN
ncbi:MAG: hypothetical protein R3F50_18730 [Gammaproteobacteria bacterium]